MSRGEKARLLIALVALGVFVYAANWVYNYYVDKGVTGIGDPFLEDLFRPDVPHRYVEVFRDEMGRKVVVVKMNRRISGKTRIRYMKLLVSRGFNLYVTHHYGSLPWQTSVTGYAMTVTRKLKGEPDTIETSTSIIKDPETGKPMDTFDERWREFRFTVDDDFGYKWEKVRIIPEKEPEGEDPVFGRYPGSKIISYHRYKSGGGLVEYAVRDSLRNVVQHYQRVMGKYAEKWHIKTIRWEEMVERPDDFILPFEIFGVKTRGAQIRTGGGRVDIWFRRSLDPSLSDYIWIKYNVNERFYKDGIEDIEKPARKKERVHSP